MSLALALLLLATPGATAADRASEQALADRAEAAFAEGTRLRHDAEKARAHFRQAAAIMEELRQHGINNPLLCRNLGNAYLLADDLPHAILTYRQGLRLVPGDRELARCLNEARELVVYPEGSTLGPQRDDHPPWVPRLQPRWFFAGAVVCYLAAWLALTRWVMVRRAFLMALALAAGVGATGLVMVVFEESRRQQVEVATPLVVIADDGVLLRKGNSLSFPPRWQTPVNKGVEARLLFERGDFVQIHLAGGEIGWVPRNLVLVDRP